MGNRKQLIIGIALISILLLATLVYKVTFDPEHRVIAEEQADYVLTAKELQASFSTNEQEAIAQYLDGVLQLSGQVTEVEEASVVLDDRVQVNFLEGATASYETGQALTVKGRCVGYDELLLQVKLDQATSLEQTNEN